MDIQNQEKDGSATQRQTLLVLVLLIAVIVLLVMIFSQKTKTVDQQAATLSSSVAKSSLEIIANESLQTEKDRLKKSAENSKKIKIQVDPALDTEGSKLGGQTVTTSTGFETSTAFNHPFVWVNPGAQQTLTLSTNSNGQSMLSATHKYQIVSQSDMDTYVAPNIINRQLVGGRENPLNAPNNYVFGNLNMLYGQPTAIYTSSNISSVNVDIMENGQVFWTIPLLKIPAGEVGYFRVVYNDFTNLLYPDSYYSEIGEVFAMPGGVFTNTSGNLATNYQYLYQTPTNYKAVPSNKTTTLNVVGEATPYLLNWEPRYPDLVDLNTNVVVKGVRLGTSVDVIVSSFGNGGCGVTTYNFTKPTTPLIYGQKTFEFVPANEGIALCPGGGRLRITASNPNGLSNAIYLNTL